MVNVYMYMYMCMLATALMYMYTLCVCVNKGASMYTPTCTSRRACMHLYMYANVFLQHLYDIHLFFTCAYQCLHRFRAIRMLADDGAVALTLPTQVCHRLHHDDVRQQLSRVKVE